MNCYQNEEAYLISDCFICEKNYGEIRRACEKPLRLKFSTEHGSRDVGRLGVEPGRRGRSYNLEATSYFRMVLRNTSMLVCMVFVSINLNKIKSSPFVISISVFTKCAIRKQNVKWRISSENTLKWLNFLYVLDWSFRKTRVIANNLTWILAGKLK